MTSKARALPDPANIPEELRNLDQWVAWRPETKPNATKPTKVPYQDLAILQTRPHLKLGPHSRASVGRARRRMADSPGSASFSALTTPMRGWILTTASTRSTVMEWAKPILVRFSDTYACFDPF
jgi:hypothetical protein